METCRNQPSRNEIYCAKDGISLRVQSDLDLHFARCYHCTENQSVIMINVCCVKGVGGVAE